MINLKIDPEFQSQIPPLTDDEFKQLEENIKWKQFPKFRRLWSAEFFCPHLQRHFKKRCQRIKILHLLILPEAQKVNAPDREKEMRKKKFPALGGRLRVARTGRAVRPYFLKG